ncbi:hypothetical protein PMAYCL1PPCAC_32238 [Pristionchus mayeri]|uniref:Protein kinase domain-containing protein n=1 Tax=Pristionchus mayeri TaxID=1317129 RepID=A0AAN5DEH8_9BILA|nr:hypothetical protein PMAYCL1PPCAC_32238 [Pristionchus mayeri]
MGKKDSRMTQGPGSGYYRPIETIAFGHANDRHVSYNEKVDIWSIGAILCEMITGRILFKAVPPKMDNPVTALNICGPIPNIVIDQHVKHEPSRKYLRDKSLKAVRMDFLKHFVDTGRPWLTKEVLQNGIHLVNFIDRTIAFDHTERMDVDEALAHPFLAGVRLPEKEVVSRQVIYDFGDRPMEEWKKLIWEAIQASPVQLDSLRLN